MKKITLLLCLLGTSLLGQESNVKGNWKGYLETGGRKLDIIIALSQESDKWVGSLSSETQQLKDIGINNIAISGQELTFDVPLAGGKWEGKIIGQDSLKGHWIQGSFKAPLDLKKLIEKPEISVRTRAQTPSPPFPYSVEEVTYTNPKDGTLLAGTLTTPLGNGPFPAAILLSVAGANDRDQSYGSPQHKPFWVLADHLSRNGYVVLRADDRGVGGSSGNLYNSTYEDLANDAVAGLELLEGHVKIDPNRIGFIGNSEGTLIGPLAAHMTKKAAFLITLGGIGVSGQQVILDQADAIGRLSGFDEATVKDLKSSTKDLFKQILSTTDSLDLTHKLKDQIQNQMDEKRDTKLFLLPASIDEQVKIFSSSWYRSQINYDPKEVLEQTTIPFLAIHGNLDPFVHTDKNLEAIGEHLKKAGNQHHALVKLNGINHIMQEAKTGSPAEYSSNENSFSPRVLQLITSWLAITFTKKD